VAVLFIGDLVISITSVGYILLILPFRGDDFVDGRDNLVLEVQRVEQFARLVAFVRML
jgi:hypothetical protein